MNIKEVNTKRKLAAFTCDLEEDYGFRTGTMQWLEQKNEINNLTCLFKKYSVPVTGFVVCSLLNNSRFVDFVNNMCEQVEPHSYSHLIHGEISDFKDDLDRSIDKYIEVFNKIPNGYRYPQGRFNFELVQHMLKIGLKFDSSVFPSRRPGVFDFSSLPQNPFYVDDLLELPLATFKNIRTIYSISYLKLYGKALSSFKIKMFGLPNILIIDSHMTDFIYVESFDELPLSLKLAYSRNKFNGINLCEHMIKNLKELGYEFVTMNQVYDYCKK